MRPIFYFGLLSFVACDAGTRIESLPSRATILGVSKIVAPIDDATGLVESCTYEASPTEFAGPIVLDTAVAHQLTLPLTVRNNADSETDGLQPLRMELRWECDSAGFSGDLGPLVVPAFDPSIPFCNGRRDENASFAGFDTVEASGALIPGSGGLGIVRVTAVPFALGQAIDETFEVASLAEQCCFETRATNCDGQSTAVACTRLEQIFRELDPSGVQLQVAVQNGPSDDLVRFQAFAIYNGGNLCVRDRTLCDSSFLQGPTYSMRLRGHLELLDTDGDLARSDEFATSIEFCRNCGYWNGLERFPYSSGTLQCLAR